MADIEFNKNEDSMRQLMMQLMTKLGKVAEGGGKKNADKQKEQGKMLARERIQYLIDKDSSFIEIGAFAADEMYSDYGGCPAAGVIVGIGYVSGRECVIVANDATVKAGAWFPMTGKKNLRAQEISIENRLPIIYRERRDFLCGLLKEHLPDVIEFKTPQGGLAIWTKYDKRISVPQLSAALMKKEVVLSPGLLHDASSGRKLNSTRMGFGWMNLKESERAFTVLKETIKKM